MPERDYSNNPEDYYRDYPNEQPAGGVTPPSYTDTGQEYGPNQDYVDPQIEEIRRRYNGGSPPAIPLKPGHGWEWNGSDWVQVEGRGMGYQAPQQQAPPPTGGGGPAPVQQSTNRTIVSGVPPAWNYSQSTLAGRVPTIDDAIADAKKLPGAPTVTEYDKFDPGKGVGRDARNKIVEAILARPQTLDQATQDAMFEQQKEQQLQMANQAKQRAQQQGASRGFSGGGGFSAKATGAIEGDFMNNLLQSRRDIAVQAAEINRQNELAAIQMQSAVEAGDFAQAQASYETQLKAKALYDELRFKATEFDRANVAMAGQMGMANRQQQFNEQFASFNQYLEKLKFEELMRQFNEQLELNYGKFDWDKQLAMWDRG